MGRLGKLVRRVSPRGAEALSRVYNHVAHRRYREMPIADVFNDVYRRNHWRSNESISGPGSTEEQTRRIREWLPTLIGHLGVKSMLDLPCGDFGWLSKTELHLDVYIGADIVEPLVAENRGLYADDTHRFEVLDATNSTLPTVDLVFCRDCLVHLSYDDGLAALRNFVRSGSRWLLTTTFPSRHHFDIATGNWRPVNLEHSPYSLGSPLLLLNEGCTEGGGQYSDKSLALYDLHTLRPQLLKAP